jgi:hypothetical protein
MGYCIWPMGLLNNDLSACYMRWYLVSLGKSLIVPADGFTFNGRWDYNVKFNK